MGFASLSQFPRGRQPGQFPPGPPGPPFPPGPEEGFLPPPPEYLVRQIERYIRQIKATQRDIDRLLGLKESSIAAMESRIREKLARGQITYKRASQIIVQRSKSLSNYYNSQMERKKNLIKKIQKSMGREEQKAMRIEKARARIRPGIVTVGLGWRPPIGPGIWGVRPTVQQKRKIDLELRRWTRRKRSLGIRPTVNQINRMRREITERIVSGEQPPVIPLPFPPEGFPPMGFPLPEPPRGFPPPMPPRGFPPTGFSPTGFPTPEPPRGFPPAEFPPAEFSPAGFPPAGFPPPGIPIDQNGLFVLPKELPKEPPAWFMPYPFG